MIEFVNDIKSPIVGSLLKQVGIPEQQRPSLVIFTYVALVTFIFIFTGGAWYTIFSLGGALLLAPVDKKLTEPDGDSQEDIAYNLLHGAPVQLHDVSPAPTSEEESDIDMHVIEFLESDTLEILTNAEKQGDSAEVNSEVRSEVSPVSDLNSESLNMISIRFDPEGKATVPEFKHFQKWLDIGTAPWGAELTPKSLEMLQLVWGIKPGSSKQAVAAKAKRDKFLTLLGKGYSDTELTDRL